MAVMVESGRPIRHHWPLPIVVLFLTVIISACAEPTPGGFTVYFIDVGQGDATLIVADTGESLLIDGGRSKARIRERLSSLGVADLEAVLATHPDSDHIAGLVEVFDLYPIERFYWNGQSHDTQTFQNLMAAVQAEGGYVNRCVNDIRRRPSQPLSQRRSHPRIERRDRRLRSTQGPSDA